MNVSRSLSDGCATVDESSVSAPRQDELYSRAVAELGGALSRLSAACEAGRAQQQDLLQEIHLALWRSFATFRGQCSLKTWVYRVAHNTAATHVLKEKRAAASQRVSLEELGEMAAEDDSERLADEAAVIERLDGLIRRLKPLDRDVLLLYLEGMDAAAIAEITGLSAANVAQKIHRTKQLLTRFFTP
jgi:RNA polymerase sigma-70 factor (ECF subfamily)